MPIQSLHTPFDIPDVDIWSLMFERKDREFPDDQGKPAPLQSLA
jgi:4-coumarate--CoA ligase